MFLPGDRVKIINIEQCSQLKSLNLIGTVFTSKSKNLNPKPKNSFIGENVYVLLDDVIIVPEDYFYYPYVFVYREHIEKVQDRLNKSILENFCPECNVSGEYINGAYKCPKCWKVW